VQLLGGVPVLVQFKPTRMACSGGQFIFIEKGPTGT
jgi:hypothetical protein